MENTSSPVNRAALASGGGGVISVEGVGTSVGWWGGMSVGVAHVWGLSLVFNWLMAEGDGIYGGGGQKQMSRQG